MRRGNVVVCVLAGFLFMHTQSAHAQSSSVADDLARSQDRTMLLKAQLAEAQALAELRKVQAGLNDAADKVQEGAPVSRGTFGRDGKLYAELVYPNGTTAEAWPGETVQGGYRVVRVGLSLVELSRDGRIFRIGNAGSAPQAAVPTLDAEVKTAAPTAAEKQSAVEAATAVSQTQ